MGRCDALALVLLLLPESVGAPRVQGVEARVRLRQDGRPPLQRSDRRYGRYGRRGCGFRRLGKGHDAREGQARVAFHFQRTRA